MDTQTIGLGEKFEGVARDGALALAELKLAPDAAILDVGTGKGERLRRELTDSRG